MSGVNGVPVTKLAYAERVARLEADVAAFTSTSIIAAVERMRALLKVIHDRSRHLPAGPDPVERELSTLFNDAWRAVDSAHLLKELLGSKLEDDPSTAAAEFRQAAAAASVVRNKMDHIHEQIDNLARKTRKKSAPLLGVVSAVFFHREQLVYGSLSYLDSIVLSHSESHHRLNFETVPKDLFPITEPVDHLRLHAFDTVVELSRLSKAVAALGAGKERLPPPSSNTRLRIYVRALWDPPLR